MVEVIAQRAQRVASGAVGGSLGREDEGIWLRAASLVARARHGPVNRESARLAVSSSNCRRRRRRRRHCRNCGCD